MTDVQQSNQTAPQPIPPQAPEIAALIDASPLLEQSSTKIEIGGSSVRFKLDDLYSGIDDPKIMQDVAEVERKIAKFDATYRGKLAERLGEAVAALEDIWRTSNMVDGYLSLVQSCDSENQNIQRVAGQVAERMSLASGNHLEFFEIEVGKLDQQVFEALLQSDPRVAKYQPYLKDIRDRASHQLSEDVERALSLRSPFGVGEWSELLREREAALRFPMTSEVFRGEEFFGQELRLEQAICILAENQSQAVRAEALRIINETLKDELAPFMTRALNIVAGRKNVEDRERQYSGVMTQRNESNHVADEVVDALHSSVAGVGSELCKRYYRLMAQQLGVDTLNWSDRNAQLPGSHERIPWDVGLDIVRKAYQSFSPTLAKLVDKMIDSGWVDAPSYAGKESGAFNMSIVLPEPHGCRAYTLLNYLGTSRDVSTVAHEFGHGVHGLLGGEAQGALMYHAPIALCETASIFAEMVTFEYLKEQCSSSEEKLALLMGKIGDFMNSVVRQIGFSNFERRLHEERKTGKLTSEMLTKNWLETVEELYGKNGEVFNYQNMDQLWSYVTHFMRPFYVYGYAFGELLTQSLYAVKDTYGERFEPLYLDLLRAGGTKNVTELLAPFGLDPKDPEFWKRGMEASVGKWLQEAEELSKQISAAKAAPVQ